VSTREAGLPPASGPIWTSFATGQLPAEHGILAFAYMGHDGVRRLYSSGQRKVPALWEIASSSGLRAGVVNWWTTYPAERIRGFVVSDRYLLPWARQTAAFNAAKLERDEERITYPPAVSEAIAAVPLRSGGGVPTPAAAEAVDRDVFALAYAALAEQPVDLLMVYTRALDELSHLRWHTHEPLPGQPRVKDDIVDFMKRYDGLLGELLRRLDPADHLVVLSDHGFEQNRKPGGPSGIHASAATAVGVLLLHGPRIAAGTRIERATLLDVAPTVLELLKIPPAADMPGEVLAQAFHADRQQLLARVARYERSQGEGKDADGIRADRATLEHLRSLGYIE
jgi:predicted AlkP superfamily phosphohydrolase/phosphomutase